MARTERPRALLDSSILLAWIKGEPEAKQIESLLDAADRNEVELVESTMIFAEVFKRATDDDHWAPRMELVLAKLRSSDVTLADITRPVAELAATYRTTYKGMKKSPDAIHLATAVLNRCDWLVTLDRDFPADAGVRVFNLRNLPPNSSLPWIRSVQEGLFEAMDSTVVNFPVPERNS